MCSKKRSNIFSNSISCFFAREPFKKEDVLQKPFLDDLCLCYQKPSSFIVCGK
jgi:hypothetical protein